MIDIEELLLWTRRAIVTNGNGDGILCVGSGLVRPVLDAMTKRGQIF